jgi:hypothetical protein
VSLEPVKTDPEVAALTFAQHLDAFFASGRGTRPGWGREDLGPLTSVIRIPAVRENGAEDFYFVRLGAEYYPTWPTRTAFVAPLGDGAYEAAADGTRWWPRQSNQPGFPFGLHTNYQFADGHFEPLICFSYTFEYYVSNHSPAENERWDPARHTLAATLNRLGAVLTAPNYQEPSG